MEKVDEWAWPWGGTWYDAERFRRQIVGKKKVDCELCVGVEVCVGAGCSSVEERVLCMYEILGSIPHLQAKETAKFCRE